jgi:dipeptidyl aminopeptidase/acylaminoacyl peptidase
VIPADLPHNLQDAYLFAANDADALKKVSPLYHLDYINVPIQVHYGAEDGKVLSGTPPQWSVTLTQSLRDAGKQVEMYQYEGERHSFIGEPWFVFMGRVLRFFDRNLK